MSKPFEIPNFALKLSQDRANTMSLKDLPFNEKLFIYDTYNEEGGIGYHTAEDFISFVIGTEAADINVPLLPTTILPVEKQFVEARYMRDIVNDNPNVEEGVPTLIYSQNKPVFLIRQDLDLRDKFLIFTKESIFTEESGAELDIIKDIEIYVKEGYDITRNNNGEFQYATLTLKRLRSYQAKDKDGNYYRFNFTRGSLQPLKVKKIKISFNSKPFIKGLFAYDNLGTSAPLMKITNQSSTWRKTPLMPIIENNKVSFSPIWTVEKVFLDKNKASSIAEKLTTESGGMAASNQQFGQLDFAGANNGRFGFPATNNYDGLPLDANNPEDFPFYRGIKAEWEDILGIGAPNSDQMLDFFFGKTKEIFNNFISLSHTGLSELSEKKELTGPTILPRRQEQNNALWFTYREEAYGLYDTMFAGVDIGTIIPNVRDFYWITSYQINNEKNRKKLVEANWMDVNFIPYIDSELEKEHNIKLLQRELTWMGETYSGALDENYEVPFDFSPSPLEWDKDLIKKNMGLYPNEIFPDEAEVNAASDRIGPTSTEAKTWGIFSNFRSLALIYRNFITLKSYKMKQNFYNTEGFDFPYILEVELNNEIDVLTKIELFYFGGYEFKLEFFDSDGNPSKYFGYDGQLRPLDAQYHVAENRRGNPKRAITRLIYGSGGPTVDMRLVNHNKKLISENSKKIINLKTGKKIKNKFKK